VRTGKSKKSNLLKSKKGAAYQVNQVCNLLVEASNLHLQTAKL